MSRVTEGGSAPQATDQPPPMVSRSPTPAGGEQPRLPSPAAGSRTASEKWWNWLTHWQLWLALGVGTFLRAWHLDRTLFLADQANLVALARAGVLLHALPITGIPSSISALNPPLSVYLLMPFAAVTRDPFPAIVSVAVWNVVGIAACYVFALRYFGRRVAAVSALLLATCGAAMEYSRYLWQQSYLPPFLALFALVLFAWCVHGKRSWFAPAILLLTAAILLHPTAVLLVPMVLAGLVLAPVAPRLREWGIALGGSGLLLAPTFLWERLSGGADLQAFALYGKRTAQVDLSVFAGLYVMLGRPLSVSGSLTAPAGSVDALRALVLQRPPHTIFRPGALYGALGEADVLIPLAALSLFLIGWLVLTGRSLAPVLRHMGSRWRSGAGRRWWSLWQGWQDLRGDARWRADGLLWLWVSLPVLALLRHRSPLYPHYLLILSPGLFIVAGVGAGWLIERARGLGRVLMPAYVPGSAAWRAAPTIVVVLLVALLVTGQAAQSTLFIASLAGAQFDTARGGYDSLPIGVLEDANATLARLQRQQGARSMFVLTQPARDASLTYMLVDERPDRVRVNDECLVLPAPSISPALEVSSRSGSDAARLLARLPGAQHVAEVALPGGEPLQVFRTSGPAPLLPGERPAAPVTFRDAAGNAIRLDAIAWPRSHLLQLRWTVLRTAPDGQATVGFRFAARQGVAGSVAGIESAAMCLPTRWQAGETVFTWLAMPSIETSTPLAIANQPQPGAVALSVQEQLSQPAMHRVGPWRVLSFGDQTTALAPLQTSTPTK